jgi:hypothetical protein
MLLDVVFDDKRVCMCLVMVWTAVIIVMMNSMGIFHSEFMTVGPSPHTKFMTMHIDTWRHWITLAAAIFANTAMADFMSDAIVPWLQNTVQDHKTKYLPYSKLTCYTILQIWSIYCNVMNIFSVGLMMSQIDFICIRLLADLLVNTFTSFKFMRSKQTDPGKYSQWNEEKLMEPMDLELSHLTDS